MKRCTLTISYVVAVLFGLFSAASSARAIVPVPTETPVPVSPLLITAYSVSATGLDFVQLYNTSDELISLDGMQLNYVRKADLTNGTALTLGGLMKPGSHILLASADSPLAPYAAMTFLPIGVQLKSIQITSPTFAPLGLTKDLSTTTGVIYARTLIATGYSTASTAMDTALATDRKLYADSLYVVPDEPLVSIVEIYPHASDCAPNDTSSLCGDYIKLYNPTDDPVDPSSYRLRSDSSTSENSNAFQLDAYGMIAPHGYLAVSLRDDGGKMSLTDSGGYVWLEDAAGVKLYDDTIVNYPSAGSDSKVGYAWALADDATWQWTSAPNPIGANTFPPPAPVVEAASTLAECPEGKYRSPETNRCRSVEEAVNDLAQCDEGQERNPLTNRCRSIVTASASLTPCDAGQERNPATNRCHAVEAAAATVTACATGQERNPETNRCRKIVSATTPPAEAPVAQKASSSLLTSSLLLTAGIGAGGYGVYEWRSEIWRGLRRVGQLTARK